jgi:hypothetical protein
MGVMDNIPYVIDLLDQQFGFFADAVDFGYESVTLDRDELDAELLPDYFDEIQTDETLLVHFYNVREYIIYIIADTKDSYWYLVGVLKAGNLAYNKRFDQ